MQRTTATCPAIAALVLLGIGCAGGSEANVVHGASHMAMASDTMRDGGIVFSPYPVPAWLGAESTNEHVQCIQAVNLAAYDALRRRYRVIAPLDFGRRYDNQPRWMRAPSGPRAAVSVTAFRCGAISGSNSYTLSPSQFGFAPPGSVPGDEVVEKERVVPPSEVTLSIYDRRSGEAVIEVVGRDHSENRLDAAKRAAVAAANSIGR